MLGNLAMAASQKSPRAGEPSRKEPKSYSLLGQLQLIGQPDRSLTRGGMGTAESSGKGCHLRE